LESSVSVLNEDEIQNKFELAGIKAMDIYEAKSWSGASFLKLDQPITYWKWCVIFAIIFVFAEMLVVLFFKK
jgi:hypothetical protein